MWKCPQYTELELELELEVQFLAEGETYAIFSSAVTMQDQPHSRPLVKRVWLWI